MVFMKEKIPNFLANQRQVVSNFLDRNAGLIIGDTKKVLDIKNQYLIETYLHTIFNVIKKNKDLAYADVEADTGDPYNDFHYYPLIEIKKKGSGLNDIFKKNNHPPSGFFCIHNYAIINRRDFDLYNSFHKFTSKKNFVKSLKVSSGSICIFPLSNNLKNQPFNAEFHHNLDLDLISLGKKRSEVIKIIKQFKKDNPIFLKKKMFQLDMSVLKKMKGKKKYRENLVKSFKEDGYKYREFIEFSEKLEKKGAKIEIIDRSVKPFDQYDLNSKELKDFQKQLNSLKKQKNKRSGNNDIIKCDVENGIYDVYNPDIRAEDEIYEGKKYSQYSSAVLVLKK